MQFPQPFGARCAGLAAILACALLLAGCSSPEVSYSAHVQRAQRYLELGNLRKAQIEIRLAIQALPGRAQARVMGGRVAEELGDLRSAASLYQSAIVADPHNVEARARLGRLYVLSGNPQHALELIATVLPQRPDDPALLAVHGAARAALNDLPTALADAEHAVRVAPRDQDAVALLAALYQRTGSPQRAVALLRTTLQARPDARVLRGILAGLYEKLDQPAPAESQLRQMIVSNPRDFAPRADLVGFFVRASRLDDAERTLQTAISDLPNQERPRLALLEFLYNWRSQQAREPGVTELLARYPADYGLQLAQGAFLLQETRPDDAVQVYRATIAQAGDEPAGLVARNRLAGILITQRRFEEASTLVQQVLHVSSRDAGALELRAGIALERGQTAAAVSDLTVVLGDQPGSVVIERELARAYLADGQPALAESALRNALEAAPADPTTGVELAQLLASTQRLDAAIALLAATLQQSPKELAVREAIVRAYIARPDLEAAQRAAIDTSQALAGDWHGPYLEALVAEAQRRPRNAAAALERALALQPDALPALQEISRLEISAGQAGRAIARLRSVIAMDRGTDAAALHDLLGTVLLRRDEAAATLELRRAMDLQPLWWVPYHDLGSAQVASGDLAGAIKTYKQGVDATQLQATLVGDLASLYERQHQPQEAVRLYDRVCKELPGSTFAANNLAMLLVTYGRERASLERARDLTADFMNASNADLLDTAGWVRLKLGDVAEALPVLEDAARRAPQSGMVRYHLGMAQLQAGQRAAARASLESAVAERSHFDGWDAARAALAQLGG